MSKVATIPDFIDGDARSMSTSLRVVKQVIETLSGQRYDDSKGSPAVYVQAVAPVAGKNAFHPGDFWINSGTKKLSYYNGSFWVEL